MPKTLVIPDPPIDSPGTWVIRRTHDGTVVHTISVATDPPQTVELADALEIPVEAQALLLQAWTLIYPVALAKAGFTPAE